MTVASMLARKTHVLHTVDAGDTVRTAASILAANKIGALPVIRDDRLCGILSERDVVREIAKGGADILDRPVTELMTANVVTCVETDRIQEVMKTMSAGRFRHMPVLRDGALVGMISIGDVVKARLAEQELEVESLRSFVTGHG